jgi:hypothetical protein
MVHKLIYILVGFLVVALFAVVLFAQTKKPEVIEYGMSFNTLYARERLLMTWGYVSFA